MSIHLWTKEIASGDDIWKIFWSDEPGADDYNLPGQRAFVLSDFLNTLRKLRLDKRLGHPERRYYICCLNHRTEVQAVVPQDQLAVAGKTLLSHPTARYRHDLMIQYVGVAFSETSGIAHSTGRNS